MRKWRMAGGLAALLAAGGIAGAKTKVGEPAPAFTIRTFSGDKVASSDLRGKVVLINFWTTWCGPCRQELPEMDGYYRRHGADGLAAFAVTTEDSLPRPMLRQLAAALAIPLSNHLHSTGYGLIRNAVPTSYVIDRAGILRYAQSGTFDAARLAAVIDPLLAEPPPAAPRQQIASRQP